MGVGGLAPVRLGGARMTVAKSQAPVLLSRKRFEKLLILLVYIWVAEIGLYPIDSQMSLEIIKPFEQPIRYAGFLACSLLFTLNWRQATSSIRWEDKAFLGIWCLVAISTLINWRTSSLTFLPMMLAFLCACMTIRSLSFDGVAFIARLMRWTLYGSIMVSLLLPQYGLMAGDHLGRWRGLFLHKNQLGAFAAYFFILALFLPGYAHPARRALDVALAALVLVNAESSTALGAVLIALPVCLLVAARGRLPTIILSLLTIFIASLGIFFITHSEEGIFGLLGRDSTFSGRTLIWNFFMPLVMQRPWLGWGYGSTVIYGDYVAVAQATIWSNLRSTHNGYITIALAGGIGSLAIFVTTILRKLLREVWSRFGRTETLGIIIIYSVSNFVEAWFGFSVCLALLLFLIIGSPRVANSGLSGSYGG